MRRGEPVKGGFYEPDGGTVKGGYDPCHEYFAERMCLKEGLGRQRGACGEAQGGAETAVGRLESAETAVVKLMGWLYAGRGGGGLRGWRVRREGGRREIGVTASDLDSIRAAAVRQLWGGDANEGGVAPLGGVGGGGGLRVTVLCCGGETEVMSDDYLSTLPDNAVLTVRVDRFATSM